MNKNFTLQSSLEANYLNVQVHAQARLDEIALRVMAGDCPDFLIPFRMININNSISFKYRLLHTVALAYFDKTFHKQDFVRVYLNLLTPFIQGRDWFLDYHNLCIDPQYIFLDRATGKASFIYIPEQSEQNTDTEILQFFKDIFVQSHITGDNEFQIRLYQYFAGNQVTLKDLYRMFQEESRRTGNHTLFSTAQSTFNTGNSSEYAFSSGGVRPVSNNAWAAANIGAAGVESAVKESSAMESATMTAAVAATSAPVSEQNKTALSGIFGSKSSGTREEEKSGRGKLGALVFGGGKENKEKKKTQPAVLPLQEEVSPGYPGEEDEVIAALFGGSKKEKKAKGKSEREKKPDKKQAEKPDKKKPGGFYPFGKKKESNPAENFVDHMSEAARVETAGEAAGRYGQGGSAFSAGGFSSQGMSFDNGGEEDKTEIADEVQSVSSAYLELIDSPIAGAPFRIELDFDRPFITIGRTSSNEVQPDIAFSVDFAQIGRRHARIERRNGGYYVIDLGSVNHTLLNGQILIPNQPYPLPDGGELTFTNSRPVRYRIHL